MTTDVAKTPQQAFEERVLTRLRESIGDLMPDEVLRDMSKKAMDKLFFEKRERVVKKSYGYGEESVAVPSYFEEEIQKLLNEKVVILAKEWLEKNTEFLQELFKNVMIARMPEIVAQAIFKPVELAIGNSQAQIQNTIQDYIRYQLSLPR